MLSIIEQENFMHLIYDVIHNGISLSNLEWQLENLKSKFGDLSKILNTRMKNERYSESLDFPIMKVILESQNHILNLSSERFTEKKIEAICLLQKYGASLNILNEKYMDQDINWQIYILTNQIRQELYDHIKNNQYIKITI
jgi:hypothetical protein